MLDTLSRVTVLSILVLGSTSQPARRVDNQETQKSPGCQQEVGEASGPGLGRRGGGASNEKGRGTHTYFETLVSRRDCLAAYSLRSQPQLDALGTAAKRSQKKRAIHYDPVHDAAKISIYAPESADIKGKFLPVGVSSGSMLLTWDFRFDEHFRWVKDGYMMRHKTWRLNPGPWLAIRTDYKHAARSGKFAELLFTMPAKRFLGPGTKRGKPGWFGEMLQPQLATFYFDPDTWVRVWVFVEGLDQPVSYLSVWAADEKRDPIQLYDKIALIPNQGGLQQFQIEYDTSADQAANPNEMHSWNRNVVVLHNISRSGVQELLKRPVR